MVGKIMSDETRFRSKLFELDSSTRTCIIFLQNEIKALKVKKREVHPDVRESIKRIDKSLSELIDSNQKMMKIVKDLSLHYVTQDQLIDRMSEGILKEVVKEKKAMFRWFEAAQKILNMNVDDVNETLTIMQKIRDEVYRISRKNKVFIT